MRIQVVGVTIMVFAAAAIQAAPLDSRQVAADAKWLVHIDVDALRDSVVMQQTWDREATRRPDVEAWVAAIRDQMCMDPAKDLHGILAYGSTPGSAEGVLIVNGAVDHTHFVEKVSKAPDYRAGTHREFKWYSWVQGDGPVTCGFFQPGLLVFAKTKELATKTLDSLDGKLPALAPDHPLIQAAPVGTILLIRASGLADASVPFKSPLITQAQSLQIAWGEHESTSFSEVTLMLKTAEAADNVRTALEGLRATALLQYGTNPGLEKLLKRMKITIADSTVKAATAAPAEEVWATIESVWNQASETPSKQ